jgi:antitoxin (DNA-binding transcriptional repressor) of toxin-antitoxin stability system
MQEAKTHLSRLVEEALRGEQVVIGRAGKSLVALTPHAVHAKTRVGGQLRGQIEESPDCWKADELSDSVQRGLYAHPQRKPRKVAERRGP